MMLRDARAARVRDDRHRLRPHRVHRHRHDVPPRRRSRDHRQHVRPGASPTSRCSSSTSEGEEVPRGEPGEIVIRGYNVMRATSTIPSRRPRRSTPTAGCTRGDIGVMDERGYIQITDRVKDMFIVGGFNAYPAEIEDLMLRHPDIGQVAVVGVPDERLGEVGMAFVVPRPGIVARPRRRSSPGAARRWRTTRCRDGVEIVDELPLNATARCSSTSCATAPRARLTTTSPNNGGTTWTTRSCCAD